MDWYKKQIRDEAETAKQALRDAGVEFESHPEFAAYVIIEGTSYKAEDAANSIGDAMAAMAKGDTITDSLIGEVSECRPEFEICTNEEWLMVYGGYIFKEKNDEGDEGENEFDTKKFDEDVENVKAKFDENYVDFENAKGQRIMCHGWNGAHFTHRNGGVATFDVLTESKEKEFDSI